MLQRGLYLWVCGSLSLFLFFSLGGEAEVSFIGPFGWRRMLGFSGSDLSRFMLFRMLCIPLFSLFDADGF